MIPVAEPLQALEGQCATCRGKVFQVLIENTIDGALSRMWLKVDSVRSAGDETEAICGYSEHCCKSEAA